MRPDPLYDRKQELAAIERGWDYLPKNVLALVYGRRRLGKTYLQQRLFSQQGEVETKVVPAAPG